MSKAAQRPFLITKELARQFRLTVRETRYNSQGFPLITSTMQPEVFPSAAATRSFAAEHFGAKPGEFSSLTLAAAAE